MIIYLIDMDIHTIHKITLENNKIIVKSYKFLTKEFCNLFLLILS